MACEDVSAHVGGNTHRQSRIVETHRQTRTPRPHPEKDPRRETHWWFRIRISGPATHRARTTVTSERRLSLRGEIPTAVRGCHGRAVALEAPTSPRRALAPNRVHYIRSLKRPGSCHLAMIHCPFGAVDTFVLADLCSILPLSRGFFCLQ